MHKLRENAEKELKAIEEKGLTSSNLDNAYKLVEIMKGVDKINMMQDGGEYSRDGYSRDMEDYSRERGGYSRNGDYSREGNYSNDYENGNSYRRGRSATTGRYVHRPNYSRLSGDDTDMDEYRSRKMEYSNSRDDMTKNKMLDALEDFMSGVCGMLKQIYRDSDVAEERQIIRKYAREIADM
ncbi:hypothetical protein [Bacteroides acidifaciens]|uniref:hypothetical protein n=1 Tax=Bacteroides acidifaciens TaxID=85831 RepID=UPI0025B070FB|nr:hypothetical protein [Bacteroides acidifaciens]